MYRNVLLGFVWDLSLELHSYEPAFSSMSLPLQIYILKISLLNQRLVFANVFLLSPCGLSQFLDIFNIYLDFVP